MNVADKEASIERQRFPQSRNINRPSSSIPFLHLLILMPGLWLISHIFRLLLKNETNIDTAEIWGTDTTLVMDEFIKYRNMFFMLLAIIFMGIALRVIIGGWHTVIKKGDDAVMVKNLLPYLIESILLITYSYAIAKLLFNIYKMF